MALRKKIALLVVLISVVFVLTIVLLILSVRKEQEPVSETPQVQQQPPEGEQVVIDTPVYPLFVGDSRTVGMANAIEKRGEYVDCHAKNGASYPYLLSLDDRIRTSGSDCIVIGFGVNDLGDIDDYISYANTLGQELSKPVYFMTVNPVEEDRAAKNGYNVKNSRIDDFNQTLKGNADHYTVIDTNGHLLNIGFSTLDGLHYDEATYNAIYDYVIEVLNVYKRGRQNG